MHAFSPTGFCQQKWMSMNSRVAFDTHHAEVISLCIRWALKLCPEQQAIPRPDTEAADTHTVSPDAHLLATPDEVSAVAVGQPLIC